jgi:hypothetical protein
VSITKPIDSALQLIDLLTRALNDVPRSKDEVRSWYDTYPKRIEAVISRCYSLQIDFEPIFHFLADADIRHKDLRYADIQRAEVFKVINALTRETSN